MVCVPCVRLTACVRRRRKEPVVVYQPNSSKPRKEALATDWVGCIVKHCQATFVSFEDIDNHLSMYHPTLACVPIEREYPCRFMYAGPRLTCSLDRFVLVKQKGEFFECPVRGCEFPLETRRQLKKHAVVTHPPTEFESVLQYVHGTDSLDPRQHTAFQRHLIRTKQVKVVYIDNDHYRILQRRRLGGRVDVEISDEERDRADVSGELFVVPDSPEKEEDTTNGAYQSTLSRCFTHLSV